MNNVCTGVMYSSLNLLDFVLRGATIGIQNLNGSIEIIQNGWNPLLRKQFTTQLHHDPYGFGTPDIQMSFGLCFLTSDRILVKVWLKYFLSKNPVIVVGGNSLSQQAILSQVTQVIFIFHSLGTLGSMGGCLFELIGYYLYV